MQEAFFIAVNNFISKKTGSQQNATNPFRKA